MIRKGTPADVDAVFDSYMDLLYYDMAQPVRFNNWVEGLYPTREVAETAIANGELYLYEEDGEFCGSVRVNHDQAEEYKAIDWKYPAEGKEVLTIHGLCVPPSKLGRGIGKKLTMHCMELGKEWGCKVVRLDAYDQNTPAMNIYESLGFRLAGRGEMLLMGVKPEGQVFYEYSLI